MLGHQSLRESAEFTAGILSKYLKSEEKSGFNLTKTRFDLATLGFAKQRTFFLWDPNFEVFFVKVSKRDYSSHLLQNKIWKNLLQPDLTPIYCISVGLRLGEFSQYFLILLSMLFVEIVVKVHLKGIYRAEIKLTRSDLFVKRRK